ncbi:MAG: hypothetical protein ACK559_04005 [bacterium]
MQKIILPLRLYNRMEQNKQLTNKKGLFINMRRYYEMLGIDPFKVLPLTFHTRLGVNDPDFKKFQAYYNNLEQVIKQKDEEKKKAVRQYLDDRKKRKLAKAAVDPDHSSDESDQDQELEKIRAKYKTPR